jgi:hypothetical protein
MHDHDIVAYLILNFMVYILIDRVGVRTLEVSAKKTNYS